METASAINVEEPKRFMAPETELWQEIASDPAAVLILFALRVKEEHERAEFEKLIPEELSGLYEKMLSVLSFEEIIEVTETKIKRLKNKNHSFWIQDYRSLLNATPTLNVAATHKALFNLSKNIPGNCCRNFFYPMECQDEVLAVLREARAKLERIIDRAGSSNSAKVGYTALLSTELTPRDII